MSGKKPRIALTGFIMLLILGFGATGCQDLGVSALDPNEEEDETAITQFVS